MASPVDPDTGQDGRWGFLREAMRGHWRIEVASIAAGLVGTAAVVSVPELVGRAVNAGLIAHHIRTLLILCGLIVVLGLVQASASGMRRWCNGTASHAVEAELRRDFLAHLIGFDLGYHDQVNRGQLLSRITSDLFQVQSLISATPAWIANAFSVVAVAVLLVVISPLLGLIALLSLPIVAVTSAIYATSVRPIVGRLQRARGELAGVVEEAVSGIRAVKGFGAEPILEHRLGRQADAVKSRSLEIVEVRRRYNPVLSVVPMIELVTVNWIGGYLVLHHELSVGMLLAFNAYLAIITGPVQSIGWFIVQVQRALVSGRRLEAVMSYRPAILEPLQPSPLPAGAGHVSFQKVNFAYPGSEDPVLCELDLEIEGGGVVALVGATGSGKTTIASLLARCYDPQSGTVALEGVDVAALSTASVRGAVGVVLEDDFLFDDTIMANLVVGRPDATESEVLEAARIAQVDGFVAELPEGYSTSVGERGLSLSGGQRQRVALARAILASPRVLVLDDATSAVDAATEREIIAGLGKVMDGRTIVVISHRAATIAMADRVVLIASGRVAASGSHEDLLASSVQYRRLLGLDEQDVATLLVSQAEGAQAGEDAA